MFKFSLLMLAYGIQNGFAQIKQVIIPEPIAYVAGIFDERATVERRAFESSLLRAHGDVQLRSIVSTHYAINSFTAHQTACALGTGSVAVFGPQAAGVDGALRDECAATRVPHLQAAWQPPEPEAELGQDPCADVTDPCSVENLEVNSKCCFVTLNLYPDGDEVSEAMASALVFSGWTTFTILYEDNFGLMRIQKILSSFASLTASMRRPNSPIIVRRLSPGQNNQAIFKELDVMHESRILLDCHVDNVMNYLEEAADAGMLNDYQSYILMTLEAHSVSQKLVDMTELRANISWLNMFEIEHRRIHDDPLKDKAKPWFIEDFNTTSIKLETLLIADAVTHLSTAISGLSSEVENANPPRLCLGEDNLWDFGTKLQTALLETQSDGYSGNIQFDARGQRVNYRLYFQQMINGDNPVTIIAWESADKSFNTSTLRVSAAPSNNSTSQKKVFKVISKITQPYFWKKTPVDGEILEGNDRYEGYSVDLITEIFKIMKMQNANTDYSFQFIEPTPEQDTQGKYDPKKKQWSGLIGAVLSKKADLVICDLTITEERKSVVDFSVPFMSLGISILFTKKHEIKPGRFSFLEPYSIEVWLYTATAYLVVSIVLFLSSRISPGDWENPQPCEKEPEELENIWNFKNCTWLTMGSIMTQGCDILPKAVGSRWVCAMWWFFAMIVCQTYIAQLAASLTSALEDVPIKNVEDLANQRKIEYGCMEGGSTAQFFARSKDKMYEKMWMTMNSSRPSTFCKDNDAGAQRVITGKNRYAFFMESTTIEYKVKRNCSLTQIGNLLDSKDYGIAMPANSPFRTKINTAILHMQQTGSLDEIKKKWWETKYDAKNCSDESEIDDVQGDLEMDNLIGAFLVLLVGCACSVVIAAFEFLDHVRNIVIAEQISHWEAFVTEMQYCLNLFRLQKPVQRQSSVSPSPESRPRTPRPMPRFAASFIDGEKLAQN